MDDMEANRKYKDTVFRDLFGTYENRQNALSLYNALTGTHHEDVEALEITTLDDVLYLGMKNDISILIDDELLLWEHQSTHNPNMPLRGLMYFGKLYDAWAKKNREDYYHAPLISVPTPRYYVFYAGAEERPDSETLRFSDAYEGEGDVEVVAHVLNVNEGHNKQLLAACEPLAGYARLVALVRAGQSAGLALTEAVDAAMGRCIDEGVLAEYLESKKRGVRDMFLTEFDAEEYAQIVAEVNERRGIEKGLKQGREQGRSEGREEGTLANLRSLMANLSLTAPQALDALGIPEPDRPRYEALLAEEG